MTRLRTTVIMKTDISGSTVRIRGLAEAELHTLLNEHRAFLSRHAAAQDGRIVKPEGDGFWLVYPSVTAAARAAMTMQEELRLAQPNRGDDRLAMRVVVTLGDVLHEEGALLGETIALTARIESITPPDEIYLSAAAWLVVNQAEIRTAFIGTFPLKGFSDAVPVYRVEQTHRTRVIPDQYVVRTDLRGFIRIRNTSPLTTVEKLLDTLYELIYRAAGEFGGVVRFGAGDGYCLTFPEASLAMAAAERLRESWAAFVCQEQLPCPMNLAVHHGMLYAFRSYFYGPGVELAMRVGGAAAATLPQDEGAIFVTGEVRSRLAGTVWERRLEATDIRLASPRLANIEIYRLGQPQPD